MSGLSMNLHAALKRTLRQRGHTYAHAAEKLNVSEATIKRDFSRRTLSLERFAEICEAFHIALDDVLLAVESDSHLLTSLTVKQEAKIVADPKLWLVAICALNQWTFDEILERFDFKRPELTSHLIALDGIGILKLHAENRITLTIARNFRWAANGPFMSMFREKLVKDFLADGFDNRGDFFRLVTGNLSAAAIDTMNDRLRNLAEELATLHARDARIPRSRKRTVTLLLTLRDWEPKLFDELKKSEKRAK
jgi:transcriptional regulator with XRE-family HTH domain